MKTTFKALISMLLVFILVTSSVACNKRKDKDNNSSGKNTVSSETSDYNNTDSSDCTVPDSDMSGSSDVSNIPLNDTSVTIDNIDINKLKCSLPQMKTANILYYIRKSNMSDAELVMIQSLQGILAQKESQIYILDNEYWFNYLKDTYGIKFIEYKNPWDLVEKFKGSLKNSGFVLFEFVDNATASLYPERSSSINKACTIAGLKRYLVIEKSLKTKALSIGLKEKADATLNYEYDIYQKYQNTLNKNMIVQQTYDNFCLRDLGVATKSLYFYDTSIPAQYEEVLDWLNPNAYVFGWHPDEESGVSLCSQKGLSTIASDWAFNITVYAGLPSASLTQKNYAPKEKSSKNVHYVTFLGTDGDNLQYQINSYYSNSDGFGSKGRGKVPFGWTVSPAMYNMAPNCLKNLYNLQTTNDNFVASVSGIGYIYPELLDYNTLKAFADSTSEYMSKLDLSIVNLLLASDEERLEGDESTPTFSNLKKVVDAYASQRNIQGGIINYGVRYCPTKAPGGVIWSNGKPFVNAKESMWSNGMTKDAFVSQMAYRINNYPKDSTIPEGYTAIMVHAWSYKYSDVVALSRLLDDNVVIVTPEEFILLMKKNIKNKSTKLYLDGPINKNTDFDYSKAPHYVDISFIDTDSIAMMKSTSETLFNFGNGSCGWIPIDCGGEYDNVELMNYQGKQVFMTDGSKFGNNEDNTPNAYIYNKINLPNLNGLKMKIVGAYNDVLVRVQILDENSNLETVCDYTLKDNVALAEWSVDISKYKGRTVTVLYEVKDSCDAGRTSGDGERSFTSEIRFEQ